MDDLEKSILATLAYYDVLNRPLTACEIWRCLVRPPRFRQNSKRIAEEEQPKETIPFQEISLSKVLLFLT